MTDNFLYGRFTATYENDCMSYTANDWKDAMNQALYHEGDDTGNLLSVKREITVASAETQAAFLAAASTMNTLALLALSDPNVDAAVAEGINERQQWLSGCDWPILGYDTADPPALDGSELNADERKAVDLIDGDERLAFFAAGCGSDDLEERLADEIERNDLDISVGRIDFVKVMNYFQNT